MKRLKLGSDGLLALALVWLVVAIVVSARWAYVVAGGCLVASVALTVARRRIQATRRAARA